MASTAGYFVIVGKGDTPLYELDIATGRVCTKLIFTKMMYLSHIAYMCVYVCVCVCLFMCDRRKISRS